METPEQEGLQHLENIEKELEEIKNRTPNSARAFLNGMLQGSGAVIGSIATVILLGWFLTFFGVIPGLGDIAHYLQNFLKSRGG